VLAPGLRAAFGLSLPQVGVLLAAVSCGGALTVFAWGLAADRFGERITLALGLTGCAACVAAAAYAPGYPLLLALVLLGGAAGASVNSASGRAVMHWFAPEERGFALGLRQTSLPVGGLLAALGLPALEQAAGVDGALLGLAALCLAASAAGWLLIRERAAGPPGEDAAGERSTVRDRRLLRLGAASGLYVGAQIAMIGFVVLFLHDARGLPTAQAAAVLAGMYLLGAVLRVVFGRRSDRTGARVGLLRRVGLATVAGVGLTAALTHAPLGLLVPVLVAAGGCSMAWNGLSFTAAVEFAGHRRSGAAIGVQQTFMAVSTIVAPILFAALVAATSWWAGFSAAALVALAGWWLLASLAEPDAVAALETGA
jgi:sugar phosphate permease